MKAYFTVSGDLRHQFKAFLLLLLCLGGVRQQLSNNNNAGVACTSTAAESVPKASPLPDIISELECQ